MIYNILLHIHSIIRWIVVVMILLALVNAFVKYMKKYGTNTADCAFNRLTLIFSHFQLISGLILYFISPKVIFAATSMKEPVLRFFLVEHILLMLVAIALITVGYMHSEKSGNDLVKYKRILIYYGIAFLCILIAIPWPFRNLGGGWF